MDSKTLLILTIFAFLCAPSYSSNSLTTPAQKFNGLLKRESHEHKLRTRAEAAAKEVSPLEAVSRTYGHHHHHGYYKHYRGRAVSDATAKSSGTQAVGGKDPAAIVSRKHGHGHHNMRNSYYHGHHKYHRARSLVPEKNQETKVLPTTINTMGDKKILARAAPEPLPGKTADNKTLAAPATEGGKTSTAPVTGTLPSQGDVKVREAESHYKHKHYSHHGYGY